MLVGARDALVAYERSPGPRLHQERSDRRGCVPQLL